MQQLSDDSLQFAYDHAIAENLDHYFIKLLESELMKRKKGPLYNITSLSKMENVII
ncbi:sporulation histidine kinase inhibitor Sda [Sutcliffiella horikoshii]|nr:sporulation histidine kinase inhibitor Sda [Sutcliffiella horikoshii]